MRILWGILLGTLLFALPARADTLPSWDLTANGYFGGGTETFRANLTLDYSYEDGGAILLSFWTGDISFAGVLGDWTADYSNTMSLCDGRTLATDDPYGDEVDFDVSSSCYLNAGPDSPPTFTGSHDTPPVMEVPYLYSCLVAEICAEFGTHVQEAGLFSEGGGGEITQTATLVGGPVWTPEPGTWALLALGLLGFIPLKLRKLLDSTATLSL